MKMKYTTMALAGAVALTFSYGSYSQQASATFLTSLGADFAADFVGGPGTPPQNNPLTSTSGQGTWTFYAEGDSQGAPTVAATSGDVGAGTGSGWDDPGHGIGGYARGGPHGIGPGAGDAVVQHSIGGGSVSKIDYLVPVTGTYDLGMNIQQPNFEPARSNRFDVYLNDFNLGAANLLARVDATLGGTGPVPGVNGGASGVALNAGDILTLAISADGAGGDGVGTFVGVNLVVELIPEPASVALMGLGGVALLSVRRRK